MRKFVLVAAFLAVAILSYCAIYYSDLGSPSGAILASELTSPAEFATSDLTLTLQPTVLPATSIPIPTLTPKPTVGYIDVSSDPAPDDAARPAAKRAGKEWDPMERAIMIDQNAQQTYVYENGFKIKTIPCSTGKPILDHFTPTWVGRVGELRGTIFSFGVYADNAWELFKASGTILIHGAPYVYIDGKKVYQDLDSLGHYPSSHGCIRVHPADADWLTAWDISGVPVVVTPWQGGFTE